jgi:tetratricopeptide (TPR) repeat protein
VLVPRAATWNGQSQADNVFKLLFGEGRRLFANECFTMADVYFHSGYYPSIFDRQEQEHDVAMPAHGRKEDEPAAGDDFMGPPPDWIAAWERHFVPNHHTHLDTGGATGSLKSNSVQEILPWLKLAADLNPQLIETYTVGAYWMQTSMHDYGEAKAFLYDGLHNNPGNCELLFDLGRLYDTGYHDPVRARNVWLAALRSWEAKSYDVKTNVDARIVYEEIAMNLAHLEENQGNWSETIRYLEMVKRVSPNPAAIEKQIEEARRKSAAAK